MKNNIVTERLSMNLLTMEDHDFIMELLNTKAWLDFIGDRNVHSTEEAVAYTHKIMNTPDLFYWVVKVKEGNISVGIISFLKRSYLESFDIGFAFLPEFSRNGYAYEAAGAILEVLSKYPEYYPVLATTVPQNEKSIRLLAKLGFHFEKEIEVGQEWLCIYSNAITVQQ
jgi:[ribosomal protein S5]-alanine N-acetyltransferase